jgi:hypothetical protein
VLLDMRQFPPHLKKCLLKIILFSVQISIVPKMILIGIRNQTALSFWVILMSEIVYHWNDLLVTNDKTSYLDCDMENMQLIIWETLIRTSFVLDTVLDLEQCCLICFFKWSIDKFHCCSIVVVAQDLTIL